MTVPVRFVTASDGTNIAYVTVGSGRPLVWVANWLTHLELDFESPVWRHWIEFFARGHRLLRYDERGCGLSDHVEHGFDLDTWERDLEAVVDAVGFEEFDLLGLSQGGPIAVEYAVRHPERVRRLILFGTFPRGDFLPTPQAEVMFSLIETMWGTENPVFRQVFTSLFIPDGTDEQRAWFNTLQARSTTPAIAGKLVRAFHELDVMQRLPLVTTPTLVVHPRRDAAIPFAAGRAMAAGIPHCRFVSLDSNSHVPLETDPGWPEFCRVFLEFTGVDHGIAAAGALPTQPTGAAAASTAAVARPVDAAGAAATADGAYRFARCRLDTRSRELFRDERPVAIEQRAFKLLRYLIENRERAIGKDELQDAVWPGMILTESALTRCIMKVRRAVGDDPQHQSVIKTLHGHGYRFVAPLT